MIQAASGQSTKVARDAGTKLSQKLTIAQIDAQWLNRTLTKFLTGKPAEEILKIESQILTLLGNAAVS